MFTLIINYTKPLEQVDKFRVSHIQFVDKHFQAGTFIACGRQEPNEAGVVEGGLIWARGLSRKEITDLTKTDPYVIENVAEYKIIEFNPIKSHEGLKQYL